MKKTLIVSLHDLHPRSFTEINNQRNLLEKWGVATTSVLVIPEYHHDNKPLDFSNGFTSEIKNWHKIGHELVLHGYYHDRVGQLTTVKNFFWTNLYTSKEAEFLDLPESLARERLIKGKEFFSNFDWPFSGFIAPAWLMAPHVPNLLRELGFLYTNTLTQILPLQKNLAPVESQSLCYSTRAGWRVKASELWNPFLFKKLNKTNLIRLSLHPNDFLFRSIQRQVERFISEAFELGFTPSTYRDFVQQL